MSSFKMKFQEVNNQLADTYRKQKKQADYNIQERQCMCYIVEIIELYEWREEWESERLVL